MAALLSALALLALALPLAYLYLLLAGALRRPPEPPRPAAPGSRFALTIPAHDEEAVIADTVRCLLALDYPRELFDIYVVADHCSDGTAEAAAGAGATCYRRQEPPAGSKGAALNWLLARIRATGRPYDAVLFFDADNRPRPDFLHHLDTHLQAGQAALQGRTEISNPGDGWYPALNRALELIDGRVPQSGRSNLGFSARLSGYGFCARIELLPADAWPTGLTEDYEFRFKLLLDGVRIRYVPRAVVDAEAPATWAAARRQHARWRAGIYGSGRRHLRPLLGQAWRRRDAALLDGVLHILLPSFSTLSLLGAAALGLQLGLAWLWPGLLPGGLLLAWGLAVAALALYPFLGLALAGAPGRAYAVILSGPVFVLWRTAVALLARLRGRAVTWVRTPRRPGAE